MQRDELSPSCHRRRPILIDALNLAYWGGPPPSLRIPLALTSALIRRGQVPLMIFDASAPYHFPSESDVYARLLVHDQIVLQVHSGRPADRELLRLATKLDGCVVSRDGYKDHRRRHRRLIDDPSRRLSGKLCDEKLRVDALALSEPLAATAEAALALVRSQLADVC